MTVKGRSRPRNQGRESGQEDTRFSGQSAFLDGARTCCTSLLEGCSSGAELPAAALRPLEIGTGRHNCFSALMKDAIWGFPSWTRSSLVCFPSIHKASHWRRKNAVRSLGMSGGVDRNPCRGYTHSHTLMGSSPYRSLYIRLHQWKCLWRRALRH